MSSTTVTASNEKNAFSKHDDELAEIRQFVAKSDEQHEGYRRALYEALEGIYALTEALLVEEALEVFVKGNGSEWGKVAQKNPFQPVVSLAFTGSPAASAISKYAAVLNYARDAKMSSQRIADWIKENGGIEKLYALAAAADSAGIDKLYEETEDERIERAFAQLKGQQIGSLKAAAGQSISVAPALGNYGRALVRYVNGKLEVASVLPTTRNEIRDDLFKLVPEEAKCARRKLKEKPLYDLFRLSDIASRFFETVDDLIGSIDDQLAPVSSAANTGSENVRALAAAVPKRTKAQAKKKRTEYSYRYQATTGLRFRFVDGHWHADTISTLPTFPIVQYDLNAPLPELDRSETYYLSSYQAKYFADTFAETSKWSVRVRDPKGTSQAWQAGELAFDVLSTELAWRVADTVQSSSGSFPLNQARLQALSQWPGAIKTLAKGAKPIRFPKLLALADDDEQLYLQFPSYRPVSAADNNSMLSVDQRLRESGRREFASLPSALADNITDRFLTRKTLQLIAGLAGDYGVSFSAELCSFNEDFAALSLNANGVRLLLPLCISLAGAPAGITVMMKADA